MMEISLIGWVKEALLCVLPTTARIGTPDRQLGPSFYQIHLSAALLLCAFIGALYMS